MILIISYIVLLESKVSRLRDWNKESASHTFKTTRSWNQKFLDYEIETNSIWGPPVPTQTSWNHKFLDYEIETLSGGMPTQRKCPVGIISFSITRLKTNLAGFICICEILGWNHKFLDYEIETTISHTRQRPQGNRKVGIISFSITRLKPQLYWLYDYGFWTWVGIISFSITRLKLSFIRTPCQSRFRKLESKVSRLRDWNKLDSDEQVENVRLVLGIKSFSITRLKQQVL